MAFEEPGRPRFRIIDTAEGIGILIPSKKNWFVIIFLTFWLIGWAAGEIFVTGMLIRGISSLGTSDGQVSDMGTFGGLFTLVWLGAWTAGGAFAIYTWLWQVKGVEIITVSFAGLTICKKTPVWTRKKEYRLSDVVTLRISPSASSMWNMSAGMEYWSITGGIIAFDYGAKTVRFGLGVDEAEAKQIIKEIQIRFPKIVEAKEKF